PRACPGGEVPAPLTGCWPGKVELHELARWGPLATERSLVSAPRGARNGRGARLPLGDGDRATNRRRLVATGGTQAGDDRVRGGRALSGGGARREGSSSGRGSLAGCRKCGANARADTRLQRGDHSDARPG